MKVATYLIIGLLAVGSFSCKKSPDDDNNNNPGEQVDPAIVAQAHQFKANLIGKRFQVSDFYSDKPIDYNEEDSITTKETQLYNYTSPWIRDDFYTFDTVQNKVTIDQQAVKMEGFDSVFVKDFSVVPEKDGVKFNFYDHNYESLKYNLVEMTDTTFLVYVNWLEDSKVYTKFSVR